MSVDLNLPMLAEFDRAVADFTAASAGAYGGGRAGIEALRSAVGTLDGLDTGEIHRAGVLGARGGRGPSEGSGPDRFDIVDMASELLVDVAGSVLSDFFIRQNDGYENERECTGGLEQDLRACCETVDTIVGDSATALEEILLAATSLLGPLAMLLRATPAGRVLSVAVAAGSALIDSTVSTGVETCRERDTQVTGCLDKMAQKCESHCDSEAANPPAPAPEPCAPTPCAPGPAVPNPAPEPAGPAPVVESVPTAPTAVPAPAPAPAAPVPAPAPCPEPVVSSSVSPFGSLLLEAASTMTGSMQASAEACLASFDRGIQEAVSSATASSTNNFLGVLGSSGAAVIQIDASACCCCLEECAPPEEPDCPEPAPPTPPEPEPAPEPAPPAPDPPPPPAPEPAPEGVIAPPPELAEVPEPPAPPEKLEHLGTQATAAEPTEIRTRKAGTW